MLVTPEMEILSLRDSVEYYERKLANCVSKKKHKLYTQKIIDRKTKIEKLTIINNS